MSAFGEEGDRGTPFLFGEPNLAHVRVQMPDECLHELTQARRLGVVERRDDPVDEILLASCLFGRYGGRRVDRTGGRLERVVIGWDGHGVLRVCRPDHAA